MRQDLKFEDVDPGRIALWGDSLAGGIAVAVAGIDERVAALAVQVPACRSEPPPEAPDGSMYRAFKETILSGDIEPSDGEVAVTSVWYTTRVQSLRRLPRHWRPFFQSIS